ncbi:MAG: hypothetical protein HYX34_02370 [Actinobacteria bacterium]|nr:hypothetical protein [Actinomycetota bacterium]
MVERLVGDGAGETLKIRLLNLPVELVKRTISHGDAILRELTFVALADHPERGVPDMPNLNLILVHAGLERRLRNGETAIDVDVEVPATAVSESARRVALVEAGDRLAAEGLLLMTPPSPDVVACRRWLVDQIVDQSRGGAPVPWSG